MRQGASIAAVVWFRNDLRMHDNEALAAADREGSSLLAVSGWSCQAELWLLHVCMQQDSPSRDSGYTARENDLLLLHKTLS